MIKIKDLIYERICYIIYLLGIILTLIEDIEKTLTRWLLLIFIIFQGLFFIIQHHTIKNIYNNLKSKDNLLGGLMIQYVILSILTLIKVSMKTFITKLRIYELDELANILGAFMDGLTILITGIAISDYNGYIELFTRILVVMVSGYIGSKIAIKLFEYILHKLKQDDKWIYLVIAKNRLYGKEIADSLRNSELEVYTLEGYYHKSTSLFSVVVSNNKEESKLFHSICTKEKGRYFKI